MEHKEQWYKAADKYPFIKIADDGVPEIFADHHMLQTLRTCEQKFVTEILEGVIPKQHAWSLSFGMFFHSCMELFDEAEDKSFTGNWDSPVKCSLELAKQWGVDLMADEFHTIDNSIIFRRITHVSWITACRIMWHVNNLEQYKEEKGFKDLNGWTGTMSLLLQYWNQWGSGKERLRTVGSELCFGRNKEVPILEDPTLYSWAPFRFYLTGRIDRVVDNGRIIGPMDRKTHRFFKGGEFEKYKPNDAFVGYVYGLRKILTNFPNNRQCNGIIVDMVALKEPTATSKDKQRFKRAAREYYPSDFVEFINRNISTASAIYQLVVLGRPPQWNIMACHNQYYRKCQYFALHEVTPEVRESIFPSFYQIREKLWSPYPEDMEHNKDEVKNEDEE